MPSSHSEFLTAYRSAHGKNSLDNRPCVAMAVRMVPGYRLEDEASLYEPSMIVYPVPDPVLGAILGEGQATPRGLMSWQFGLRQNRTPRTLTKLLSHISPGLVMPEAWAYARKGPRPLDETNYRRGWAEPMRYIEELRDVFMVSERTHGWVRPNPYAGKLNAHRAGVITFGLENTSMWLKFFTNNLELPTALKAEIGEIDLNLRPAGRVRRDPRPIRPAVAVAVCEWAASIGMELVDGDGSGALPFMRRRLAHHIVAWTTPGQPAQAAVSVGSRVAAGAGTKLPATLTKARGTKRGVEITERASSMARCAAKDLSGLAKRGIPVVMHPAVADMADLSAATPVVDARLRNFQCEAVGRHLATGVGYANLCSPGAGKTIMALDGMRRRAEQIAGYRGLVVAEASVRHQFAAEAATWFPIASVVCIESSAEAEQLQTTLQNAGDYPVVVITSYALASRVADTALASGDVTVELAKLFAEDTDKPGKVKVEATIGDKTKAAKTEVTSVETVDLGAVLRDTHWHDLVADEADCLRNSSSKQSKALWVLRDNAEVALALTGTPIARSVDDLGRIVAWVRGDRHMFAGVRLAETFDLSKKKDQRAFHAALGPVLFRYDKSEFADELPPITDPQVISLKPTLAEKRLAVAARDELKRVYQDLLAWIEQVAAKDPSNPEYADARAALVAARGAWLGGTQLARMAASDPAALLESKSAGAALLSAQGLIEAATATAGTKRTYVTKLCVERVMLGERILVFTEFASVARGLITDLVDAGLRVGEILGGGGRARDEHVEAFARGERDVMVSTSAGERGLNLQTATTLVMYDLPWTPSSLLQRIGRAHRIGATAKELQLIFPIMAGTVEERVASIVAARAAEVMQALDNGKGGNASESEFGRAFSGLVGAADLAQLSKREAALLEVTRELLAEGSTSARTR